VDHSTGPEYKDKKTIDNKRKFEEGKMTKMVKLYRLLQVQGFYNLHYVLKQET